MSLKKLLPARRAFASLFLLCALVAQSFTPVVRGQETPPPRERRVSAPAAATPTPSPTPASPLLVAPVPRVPPTTPQAIPTTQATPATAATPQTSPQATPQPTPVLPAPRTLEALRSRITDVLNQPALAPAMLGIKVASLDTGRVIFAENAGKLLMPASNMKLYTVAAALDRLGPDFRFKTSVYTNEPPDKQGKVRGNLIIYGRGDPTFATRFNGGDYFKAIDDLAAHVATAGVKQVDGDIIGDESYFTGTPRGTGWEWDDLQWYYGADVSALTVNDNAVDLFVKPGAKAGDACLVTTGPDIGRVVSINTPHPDGSFSFYHADPSDNPPVTLANDTTTSPRGTKRELKVERGLGQKLIVVSGSLPLDDPGYSGGVAVKQPALVFTTMLRTALQKRGVLVKGRAFIVDAELRQDRFDATKLVEIASRESPPFSEIAAQTLKSSQNLYTELILRTLGRQSPAADPKLTTVEAGTSVVRTFLNEAGVDATYLSLADGSGLARQNLITADATVQLLTYMSRHRYAQTFRDAQPVAGVDGTLRNRMKNTPAAGNVRAKTGTLANVAGLSGYVTSAAGERLVFSIIVNHYPEDSPVPRQTYLDAIAVLLASFAGRSTDQN